MKNEIKEYKEYIKKQAADPDTDKEELARQLLVIITISIHIGFKSSRKSRSMNISATNPPVSSTIRPIFQGFSGIHTLNSITNAAKPIHMVDIVSML